MRQHIPRLWPFLVKKMHPVLKLSPHPTVSPVVNLGPYVLPQFESWKEFPSSP